MDAPFLKEFINTILFLIPLLALVWKGALLTARLTQLETKVQENISKFCNDHREMEELIQREHERSDRKNEEILKTLNDIQQSIVRIETKLKIGEKEKNERRS